MADNNITLDDLKKDAIPAAASEEVTEEVKEAPETPAKPVGLGTSSEAGGFKAVNIGNIVADMPKNTEEKPPEERDILGTAVYKLDDAVERYKQDMYENVVKPAQEYNEKIFEQRAEREAEAEVDAEIAEASGEAPIKMAPKTEEEELLEEDTTETSDTADKAKTTLDIVSDEEFEKMLGLDDDDDDDEDTPVAQMSEEERKAEEAELTKQFNELATPIKKSYDLSTFKIAKKPINMSLLLKDATPTKVKAADWIMLNAGKAFSMTTLVSEEIEKFNTARGGRNLINRYKEIYSIFYEHLLDDNKPKTFEAWLKTITFADNDDLIFGAYKATYQDSNIVPYNCPECNKAFMQKINIDDMIEYPDDATKQLVEDIRNGDTTSATKYEQELFQVSDKYVFGIKQPSLFSMIIEASAFDDKFREKFNDAIAVLSYVDNMYLIDDASQQLIPLDYHPDPTDFVRSTKKKILSYYKILKQLSVDEYQRLTAKLITYDMKEKHLSYVIPSCTCPKCGAVVPKTPMNPIDMLFTRHQLARLSNT